MTVTFELTAFSKFLLSVIRGLFFTPCVFQFYITCYFQILKACCLISSLCAVSTFSDHCLYNLYFCLLALKRIVKCHPVSVLAGTLHGLEIVTLYW